MKAIRLRPYLGLSILTLTTLVFYSLFVLLPAARIKANSFAAYYTAAYLLTHQPQEMNRIYDDPWFAAQIERVGFPGVYDIFNINPPTMSLIFLPLMGLSVEAGRLVWAFLSLLFLGGGLILLANALGLSWRWGFWILPACLLYAPVLSNFWRGQVYLLLFGVLCLVFWALRHNHDSLAGAALGLMLILKTAGVWLFLLLLFSGRWRGLIWAITVVVGVGLISLPCIGLETWLIYASQLPQLTTSPKRYVTAYQTMAGLWGHLLVYDSNVNPAPALNWPLAANLVSQLIFLATLLISIRWGRLNDERVEMRTLTLAMFLALIVTNAPLAGDHHYILVLPSLLVAGWWAWQARLGRVEWLLLAMAALMLALPLPYHTPRLGLGWLALLAYPRVYGAYLLWFWLIWALSKTGFSSSANNSATLLAPSSLK